MDEAVPVKRGRGGRPPAAQAGDVEARLLEAATRLFLERGYDGTSCDQVALDAGAGKASIYARYANKAALFSAVVERMLARFVSQDTLFVETPLAERLGAVGMRVLADTLHADALALLRLLVAQLPRSGAMALQSDQLFWQAAVGRAAKVIALRDPDRLEQAEAPAEQFMALVLAPSLMRALLGEPVAPLLAAGPARIDTAIAMLARSGALDGWS